MLKNSEFSYGLIAILFHWISAIIIIIMLSVGFTMTSLAPSPEKWQLYSLHMATGTIVLSVVTLRFLWRLVNPKPALPLDLPSWQKLAARLNHYLLYIFMFLMPLSGISTARFGGHEVNIFNLFIIPAAKKNMELAKFFNLTHSTSAWIFLALIILHIGAALYHHFIRKDNVLIRMAGS